MSPCESVNTKDTTQSNPLHPPSNKSNLDRYLNSSEMPQIPELRDENGRDLLDDETEPGERPAINREWSSDTLRKLDRFWYGSAKSRLPSSVQTGNSSAHSVLPSRTGVSRAKWSVISETDVDEHMTMNFHGPPRSWDMEKAQPVPSRNLLSRFYSPEIVKEKLIDPENYKDWAVMMEKKIRQRGEAWGFEPDLMLVLVYGDSSTQWAQVNPNVWMMIFSNVSKPIKQDLSALGTMDAREAWQFLERTCGGDVPLRIRSVKGVRDIMNIRYDECTSLREYLDKMMLCTRAIECNPCGDKDRYRGGKSERGGKHSSEDNEWLWCQFILVNLGPEWESWVSVLMEKSKGERMCFRKLFPIIETEEARRIQASRYTKRCEE